MNSRYIEAGVDVSAADRGIGRMAPHLSRTWSGGVMMDIGYFANVVQFGHERIALTMDGVGSKTEVARDMDIWDTIGIDCVAANANDLICVGATPFALTDYVGTDLVDTDVLEAIARGLGIGATFANLDVVGGEISQLPGLIHGIDLVGAAVGMMPPGKPIITGADIQPGDVVIGLASSGIHCNGLTLARRVLPTFRTKSVELGHSIGEELLIPTRVYVRGVLETIDAVPVRAAINITGDGLLNLNRVAADNVEFVLDGLPPEPRIFDMIRVAGTVDEAEMFQTFNMGIGFCLVVPDIHRDTTLRILRRYGPALTIGCVRRGRGRSVRLVQQGLIGRGKEFRHASH